MFQTTNERAAGQDEIDRLVDLARSAKYKGDLEAEAKHLAAAEAVWKAHGGHLIYGCTISGSPDITTA